MKYIIKRINRCVDLNDELVNEYIKYSRLKDSSFMIVLRSKYGSSISDTFPTNNELSFICNKCLLNELKAIHMLPKALEYIEKNYDTWVNGELQELYIGEK